MTASRKLTGPGKREPRTTGENKVKRFRKVVSAIAFVLAIFVLVATPILVVSAQELTPVPEATPEVTPEPTASAATAEPMLDPDIPMVPESPAPWIWVLKFSECMKFNYNNVWPWTGLYRMCFITQTLRPDGSLTNHLELDKHIGGGEWIHLSGFDISSPGDVIYESGYAPRVGWVTSSEVAVSSQDVNKQLLDYFLHLPSLWR